MPRKKKSSFRKLDRLVYADLKPVFSPNPDPEAVEYAWDKIARIIREISFSTQAAAGSLVACSLLSGKWPDDDEDIEYCYREEEDEENSPLVCDCPDDQGGYAYFEDGDKGVELAVARDIDGRKTWIDSDAMLGGGAGTNFSDAVKAFYSAETTKAKVLAINQVVQAVHGRGKFASWFVEGGTDTLDKLHLQKPNLISEFHTDVYDVPESCRRDYPH